MNGKWQKVFKKEWAEALAASVKGPYFEQDKLLELDGVFYSKQFCVADALFTFEATSFHKISQHFTAPEDSESTKLCHVYGVKNFYNILFAALQVHGGSSARCYTCTSLKF